MNLRAVPPGERSQHVAGPGDLNRVGTDWTIVVGGVPVRDRDFGLWSCAIGQAVLRGASVRRVS